MTTARESLPKHIGLFTAIALVVANIIGAGIFTTTGFQAADLGHPGLILLLWVVGGLLAFCGALCYGELGAAMPAAGAEYHYLRETYGPAFGFMSAFVSLVAGFSAPIAAAVKGLVAYAAHFVPALAAPELWLGVAPAADWAAITLVWLLILVHLRGAHGGMSFNDLVTAFKVAGIIGILLAAVLIGRGELANLTAVAPDYARKSASQLFGALGTGLIFVMFCYSGWNASAYVASEMKAPGRDLPRSLLWGTLIVVIFYLGLNAVYLYGAGVAGLAGQVEVGLVAARRLFGPLGIDLVTLVLCVSILASASAMTIAGPRIYYAFGRHFPPLAVLARTHPRTGSPAIALVLQGAVTSMIVLSGTLDQIQQYAGFTLTLFSSLAVSCVIVLRVRRPDMPRPFRVPGYPFTPILFLTVSAWTMFWAIGGRPWESLMALITVVAGGALFALLSRRRQPSGDEREAE